MGVIELMPSELICLDMKASEKVEGIKELAQLMQEQQRVSNAEEYLTAVLKREAECSTGIGFGVGIPHGKSAAVQEPSLAFGRSISGIQYDSMDGKPVHLLFLIAVPETANDEHLRILSQLSRKLMHQSTRDQLMQAQTKEEIYALIQ